MRAVVQRVKKGRVLVNGEVKGEIGPGLVVLVGVERGDGEGDVSYLAGKIANLRIFEDRQGKMNLSVLETGGEVLVVSQFTLFGDCRHGRRPSFSAAAPPDEAEILYERLVEELKNLGLVVATGVFQAYMMVEIYNDGPVTFLLDSKKHF